MKHRLPSLFTRFWFLSLMLCIAFIIIWIISLRIKTPARPSTFALQAALASRIPTFNTTQLELHSAIEFLQDTTDVPIEVDWTALRSVGIERETPLTRHLTNLRAGEVLDSFCWVIGSRYQITTNGSRIRISIQGAPWRDLTGQKSFDPRFPLDSIELYELLHKGKPPPLAPFWEKVMGSNRYTLIIDRGVVRLWV